MLYGWNIFGVVHLCDLLCVQLNVPVICVFDETKVHNHGIKENKNLFVWLECFWSVC